jgi:hypothetical protein
MRASRAQGILIYCSDYHCSHYVTISGYQWAADVRRSELEPRFVCPPCGRRGGDIRPNFDWDRPGALIRDY